MNYELWVRSFCVRDGRGNPFMEFTEKKIETNSATRSFYEGSRPTSTVHRMKKTQEKTAAKTSKDFGFLKPSRWKA